MECIICILKFDLNNQIYCRLYTMQKGEPSIPSFNFAFTNGAQFPLDHGKVINRQLH